MSITNCQASTTAAVAEEENSVRWYMNRRPLDHFVATRWTEEEGHQAIDQSLLKTPVKNTLHVMVDRSVNGVTTIDRATLCLLTGIRDESTITEHFKKARAAGLLKSKRRFKSSSIHTLLIPGIDAIGEDARSAKVLKNWHVWSAEETKWWDSLDPEVWTPPPWQPWHGDKPQF